MWVMFTKLGDAAITLPVAALCAGWLALSNLRLAIRWIVCLAAGMAVVGVTKILYAGWGVALPALHFRVISGHTMLSLSVWIVALSLQLRWWRQPPLAGVALGTLIGLLTGVARIMDHSHSWPEVVSGWALGACVAAAFLWKAHEAPFQRIRPVWPTVSLLVVSTLAYGHTAPLQRLIETHSRQVHRDVPSVTAFLHPLRQLVRAQETTPAN